MPVIRGGLAVATARPGRWKRRAFPRGERREEAVEAEVVVEFLGRVAERFRRAPQERSRRGVIDDHAVLEVVPVGRVGGPWQGQGALRGLGEVRCCVARHGGRRGEMGEDGTAGAGRAVRAPGEVSSQPEDVAGEVLRVGGMLEQRGVEGAAGTCPLSSSSYHCWAASSSLSFVALSAPIRWTVSSRGISSRWMSGFTGLLLFQCMRASVSKSASSWLCRRCCTMKDRPATFHRPRPRLR